MTLHIRAAWASSPRVHWFVSLCCLQHLWKHSGALSGAREHLVTVIIPSIVFSPSQQNCFLRWLSHCSVEKDTLWGKRLTDTLSTEKLAFQLWDVQCCLCPGFQGSPAGTPQGKTQNSTEVARWRGDYSPSILQWISCILLFFSLCRHNWLWYSLSLAFSQFCSKGKE